MYISMAVIYSSIVVTYSSIMVRSTNSQVSLHSSSHHQEYRGTHCNPATEKTEISQIMKKNQNSKVFAGADYRAGPDSMSILCLCICVSVYLCVYLCI